MTKVLILGASGMLGFAVATVFAEAGFELTLSSRKESQDLLPNVGSKIVFDAMTDSTESLEIQNFDYVINCVGIIKPRIHDNNQEEREAALVVNSLFPSKLASAAEQSGAKVIQIATDCVYSRSDGNYSETSPHDALDVYGKTKSLGETPSAAVMHLRVSTIGPEQGRSSLLLEWVRSQPQDAQITGYTDHLWNGITTKAFARIASGIISSQNFKPGVHHIVPADRLTKSELVSQIAQTFGRNDIKITPAESAKAIDRTLTTNSPELSLKLWTNAGYPTVPTIAQLIAEIGN